MNKFQEFDIRSPCVLIYVIRVGNVLFSVETQTTEERTQLYNAEIDALYKDLTAKGKVLVLSTELGVRFFFYVDD